MYDATDESTRAKYEEEVLVFNSKVREPPNQSEIYAYVFCAYSVPYLNLMDVVRSQKAVAVDTTVALKKLCGWERGGHSDGVFFVLGAFRDQNSKIVTFRYICSFLIFLFLINSHLSARPYLRKRKSTISTRIYLMHWRQR